MTELKPNTPVLVGVGIIEQRLDNPEEAREAYELMGDALQVAADDAGSPLLISDCDLIYVPQGMWNYTDPARLVADKLGAEKTKTVFAQFGILQQTLMAQACQNIVDGNANISVVMGGEAKYRQLKADINSIQLNDTQQNAQADEVMIPCEAEMWLEAETAVGLNMPVDYYAIMESALRHAKGLGLAEHRNYLAKLYSRFSEIAVDNPHAWKREVISADTIRNVGGKNKMLAFPYTKLHNSYWNVDQACAMIFCSAEKAQSLGVPREKWIFPLVSTEANNAVYLSQRKELHRTEGAHIAGKKALELAGLSADKITFIDLYSCFPAAVQMYAEALGVSEGRDYTFTGGMPFAGGPLNNYVLQCTCRLVELLRVTPGSCGLVSSVSGLVNKQGFGIFSTEPSKKGFQFLDVTDEVKSITQPLDVVTDYEGKGRVVGYTVLFVGSEPQRAVAVCHLPEDIRCVAYSEDKQLMSMMMKNEYCGRVVQIKGQQFSV